MNEGREDMKLKILVVGPVSTNCYIVSNDKGEAVIIDPGYSAGKIAEYLESEKLTALAILLTHGHFDHIMAVNELKEKLSLKVYAGSREADLLNDPKLNSSPSLGVSYSTKADVLLWDNETVSFSDMTFRIIHTPGHTAGSICLYMEDQDLLFSGDTLFFESVGRTDLPTGDMSSILSSLKKLVGTLPESTLVLPGHGSKTTIGHEKQNNVYLEGNDLFFD